MREELAKFISNRPCASCDGTRLRREARHVFVENTPLPTISDMSIGHAMDFFNNLKLSGQRAKIAEKVLKEIGDRLEIPRQRRPQLPDALPLGGNALRRRSPAYPSGEARLAPGWLA